MNPVVLTLFGLEILANLIIDFNGHTSFEKKVMD
jgi:hypothetical protein